MTPDDPVQPPPPPPEEPPAPREEGAGMFIGRAALGLFAFAAALAISLQLFLIPVLALVIWSVVLAIKGTFRGFALGVFLGLGLTLLGFGICLASFRI